MTMKRASIAALIVLFAACGGAVTEAAPTSTASTGNRAPSASRELSRQELAKLDDSLRERIEANAGQAVFPVRVKFVSRPPRDELTEMYLVPYERDAVGRVDRATLKNIAARRDVRMISFVDGAGYGESADGEDDDFGE